MDINHDQGIHFTGHEVQEWAAKNAEHWLFHLPYNPIAAGLIERTNELLSQQLRWKLSTRGPEANSSPTDYN